MTLLCQLYAFLRRDYQLARSSRLALVWNVLTILFATPTMYYLGRLIQPSASRHLVQFGGDYFAFVVIGVALSGLFSTIMGSWAAAMRNEQMGGTLEALLVMPASIPRLAAGASLWTILIAAGQTLLYLLLGGVVFRVNFSHVNALATAAILAVTMIVFAELGVLAAAYVLFFRSPDLLSGTMTGASVLLAGVFYPTSVLPPALQRLAEWIPLTHVLRALRLTLLKGYGVEAVWRQGLILMLFALALLVPAILGFSVALREARRSGTLHGY